MLQLKIKQITLNHAHLHIYDFLLYVYLVMVYGGLGDLYRKHRCLCVCFYILLLFYCIKCLKEMRMQINSVVVDLKTKL